MRLFWAPPGGKEAPAPVAGSDTICAMDAELLQKSEGMTQESLAPYREGVLIYECRVLKVSKGALTAKTIRVAHWGFYDACHILLIEPGSTVKAMVIVPFEQGSELMRQAKQVDSLPEDLDADLFCHLNQNLDVLIR